MSTMNAEDAAQALVNANNEVEQAPPSPEVGQPTETVVEQPTGVTDTDTFTGIDPNSLPPELQSIYKSMQADYTRKSQETSPWRKIGEDLSVDPESTRQAVEFIQRINTDPEAAIAFHNQLTQNLSQHGFLDNEDYYEDEPENNAVEEGWDGDEDEDIPTHVSERLDRLDNWITDQEQAAYDASIMNEIEREESYIRQNNPDYGDKEIELIYSLAPSTQGNLIEAEKQFKNFKQHLLTNYVAKKGSVNPGLTSPGVTGTAEAPPKFDNLDQAYEAALQHLKTSLDT